VKIRDSGMPGEGIWSSFFSPIKSLQQLGFALKHGDVVDMGCGNGTYSVAAAQLTSGLVHALDLDPDMINATATNAQRSGLNNIRATQRDFLSEGTGLPETSVGYAMLFNVLHAQDPLTLLREALRTLEPGGVVAIMHWKHEQTPRGPALSIRPRPEQCATWLADAGFASVSPVIDLPPFHYGLFATKPD